MGEAPLRLRANPRRDVEQSRRMMHVSNLYYHEPQGRLAQQVVRHLAPGKVFFSNSGAEANEGLYKLARKFGHDEGRFEIITALNSFHGRTLAGIAATGQEKVKKGELGAKSGKGFYDWTPEKADAVRARILARVGTYLESSLGPDAVERGIAASLRGQAYRSEALRDIGRQGRRGLRRRHVHHEDSLRSARIAGEVRRSEGQRVRTFRKRCVKRCAV